MDDTARGSKLLFTFAALVVVALGLKWFAGANAPSGGQAGRSGGPASASHRSGSTSEQVRSGSWAAQGGGPLIVQVAGLVRRPGVYRLPVGARTFQAIEAAGGSVGRGDPGALQLAARLSDGARVEVPARARAAVASATGGAAASAGSGPGQAGPLSLASATAEQLESLDGIGPALAKRIIEWRQAHGGFASISDLDRVPGIGPAKYEAIKGSVVP